MRTSTLAVALAVLAVVACKEAPPASSPTPTTTASASAATTGEPAPEKCELVCGAAQVTAGPTTTTAGPAPSSTPDHHAAAVSNADDVFAAMRDDLLACYAARVRQKPEAHAFLGIDLVLEPTGAVRSVETTGGALLGDKAMKCIVERVKKAKFAPVHGGGTLQIHVPFTFRRVGPDEPI